MRTQQLGNRQHRSTNSSDGCAPAKIKNAFEMSDIRGGCHCKEYKRVRSTATSVGIMSRCQFETEFSLLSGCYHDFNQNVGPPEWTLNAEAYRRVLSVNPFVPD